VYSNDQRGRGGGGREADNPLTFFPPLFVTFISTMQTLPLGAVQPEGSHKPTTGHVLCPHRRHYKTKKGIPSRAQNLPCCTTSDFYVLDGLICEGRTSVDRILLPLIVIQLKVKEKLPIATISNFTCSKSTCIKESTFFPNTITVHNFMILNKVELGSARSLDLTNSHVHHITIKAGNKKVQ